MTNKRNSQLTIFQTYNVDAPLAERLPPVGNGTYVVTMKLKKDLPNWVPVFGRKVCFEYRGIKKQCSSCFGPHIKKFCKNEKMSIEEYADRFRIRHPTIPEQLYGRLAKIENINEQAKKAHEKATQGSNEAAQAGITATTGITAATRSTAMTGITATTMQDSSAPKANNAAGLRLSLRRNSSSNWVNASPQVNTTTVAIEERTAQEALPVQANAATFAATTRTATGNAVNSMLNVIRASFMPVAHDVGLVAGAGVVLKGPNGTADEDAPLKRSSASRGRGLSRGKRS